MDVFKLKADFEASEALCRELESKVANLTATVAERDATILSLNGSAAATEQAHIAALGAKDTEISTLKDSMAEQRGELKAAKETVATLQANAKTAGVIARESLGQQALSSDAIDHLPDGSQRSSSPPPDASLKGRNRVSDHINSTLFRKE